MKHFLLSLTLIGLGLVLAPVFSPRSVDAQGVFTLIPSANGDDTGTSLVSVVAGNGSKGSWTQLIASTTRPSVAVMVDIHASASTSFCDLGTGASPTVVIGNIVATASGGDYIRSFPFAIPAGTKISARCQDSAGNTTSWNMQVLEP